MNTNVVNIDSCLNEFKQLMEPEFCQLSIELKIFKHIVNIMNPFKDYY